MSVHKLHDKSRIVRMYETTAVAAVVTFVLFVVVLSFLDADACGGVVVTSTIVIGESAPFRGPMIRPYIRQHTTIVYKA